MELQEQLIKEFQEFSQNTYSKDLSPQQFAYWLCNYSNYEVKESPQKKLDAISSLIQESLQNKKPIADTTITQYNTLVFMTSKKQ